MILGNRNARVIERVIRMLAEERDLLLAGRFAELDSAASARDAQLARLGPLDPDSVHSLGPRVAALRQAARRNADLLKAALEGAAAGQKRLAAIRDARTSLQTYDASGAPHVQSVAAARAGRRA